MFLKEIWHHTTVWFNDESNHHVLWQRNRNNMGGAWILMGPRVIKAFLPEPQTGGKLWENTGSLFSGLAVSGRQCQLVGHYACLDVGFLGPLVRLAVRFAKAMASCELCHVGPTWVLFCYRCLFDRHCSQVFFLIVFGSSSADPKFAAPTTSASCHGSFGCRSLHCLCRHGIGICGSSITTCHHPTCGDVSKGIQGSRHALRKRSADDGCSPGIDFRHDSCTPQCDGWNWFISPCLSIGSTQLHAGHRCGQCRCQAWRDWLCDSLKNRGGAAPQGAARDGDDPGEAWQGTHQGRTCCCIFEALASVQRHWRLSDQTQNKRTDRDFVASRERTGPWVADRPANGKFQASAWLELKSIAIWCSNNMQ